jgi:hypothetical protein
MDQKIASREAVAAALRELKGRKGPRAGRPATVREALDRNIEEVKTSLREGNTVAAIAASLRGIPLIEGSKTAPCVYALREWLFIRRYDDEELNKLIESLRGVSRIVRRWGPLGPAEAPGGAGGDGAQPSARPGPTPVRPVQPVRPDPGAVAPDLKRGNSP